MTPEEEKSGLHATTVQLLGHGVMIMGASGAGKTELALTLVERARTRQEQAGLIADDRTMLRVEAGKLVASAPDILAGGVEIRGAGLFRIPFVASTALDLVIMLVDGDKAERYPGGQTWRHEGIELPLLLLPSLSSNGDSNALSRAIEATLFYERWSALKD